MSDRDTSRPIAAVTSLVCGLVAVFTSWLVVPSVLLAIGASALGVVGLLRAGKQGGRGAGIAAGGVFAGTVALLLCCVVLTLALVLKRGIFQPMLRTMLGGMPVSEMTARVDSVVNAAAIAEGCRRYAAEHDGNFPQSLTDIVAEDPGMEARVRAPSEDEVRDRQGQVASDGGPERPQTMIFQYVAGDLRLKDALSPKAGTLIVAYSGDWFKGAGRAVSFADGNARFVETNELARVFGTCNGARASLGLGAIAVPVAKTMGSAGSATSPAK